MAPDFDLDVATYATEQMSTIREVIERFANDNKAPLQGRRVYLSSPSPMDGDGLILANLPPSWSDSIAAIESDLGIKLEVRNDSATSAMSVPILLELGQFTLVGRGTARENQPIVVVTPGTGMGVAGYIPTKPKGAERYLFQPVDSEAGQATYAAKTAEEFALIEKVRAIVTAESDERWPLETSVSAERLLAADGLRRLYRALGGRSNSIEKYQDVFAAWEAKDEVAEKAVRTYCAMLGAFCGDLALTFNAAGAVYLLGPVMKRLHEFLGETDFRAEFEDKPRRRKFLQGVPTFACAADNACLLGLNRIALAHEEWEARGGNPPSEAAENLDRG
jgi:glucokinase